MLCCQRGRFLYEARPDLFPYDRLTEEEIELWCRYYEDLNRRTR